MAVEYGSMPSAAYASSPGRYDVAIVEPDGRQRLRLGTALSTAAQFDAVEGLVQSLQPGRAMVAVFGPGLAAPYGFQQVNRLIASYPDLGAIFAVDDVSTPLLQSAIRAGARDTVAVNDAVALVQSVQRVGELLAGSASRVPATTRTRAAAGQLTAVFS